MLRDICIKPYLSKIQVNDEYRGVRNPGGAIYIEKPQGFETPHRYSEFRHHFAIKGGRRG